MSPYSIQRTSMGPMVFFTPLTFIVWTKTVKIHSSKCSFVIHRKKKQHEGEQMITEFSFLG